MYIQRQARTEGAIDEEWKGEKAFVFLACGLPKKREENMQKRFQPDKKETGCKHSPCLKMK